MSETFSKAAATLFHRRIHGLSGPRLEPENRPNSQEEALGIQAEITRLKLQEGDSVAGWKCVLPANGIISCAPIYQSGLWQHGPCTVSALDGHAAIEPEFGFAFAKALLPEDGPYEADEIKSALSGIHLCFELIKSRFDDPEACTYNELLADGLFNQGVLVGPRIEAWPPELCKLTLSYETSVDVIEGAHPNLNAFAPVVWLVNYLGSRGVPIDAGQIVITGSYAGVFEVPFDTPVTVSYGNLGSLSAAFTRAGNGGRTTEAREPTAGVSN